MRAIYFLLLGLMIVISSSCRKDEIIDIPVTNIPEPGTGAVANINGVVYDQDLNLLPNVNISLGSRVIVSDENGVFQFSDVAIDSKGSLISFDVDGYFSNYRFVRSNLGQTAQVKIVMVPRTESGQFSSTQGGDITTDKINIKFPPQSIIDADGNPYNGNVVVYHHWFDPTSESLYLDMPGDLRGINSENEAVQLATYGMMAAELETENGDELQLSPGSNAELSFLIPDGILANAPNEIPLWFLDEETGQWMEQGSATKQNNRYIGEVSHFSFWNCDISFPAVKITAKIECDMETISGLPILAFVSEFNITAYGITNNDGVFEGLVPANQDITLKFKNRCGKTFQELNVSTTDQDVDLGTIEIDNKEFLKKLSGKLINCSMEPLVNGYLIVDHATGPSEILYPDGQGNINSTLLVCENSLVRLQAYDTENLKISEVETFNLVDNENSFGSISICEELDEFMLIEYAGFPPLLIEDPEYYLLNESTILINGELSQTFNFFNAEIPLLDQGTSIPTFVTTFIADPDGPNAWTGLGGGCGTGSNSLNLCDGATLSTLLNYSPSSIEGSIEGMLTTRVQGVPTEFPLKVTFKIDYDRNVETRTIKGHLWLDDNKNGLRDAGEGYDGQVTTNAPWLSEVGQHLLSTGLGSERLTINSDGSYTRENIIYEGRYNMGLGLRDGYAPTLRNVGNDESIDSEIYRYNQPFGSGFTSDTFDITTVDFENLDVGYIKLDGSECDVRIEGCGKDAQIDLGINGGTPPYRYLWPNNSRDEPTTDLSPGTYQITVYDSNEKISACTFQIEAPNNEIRLFAFVDESGGGDNVYDPGIDTPLDNVSFRLTNSAGTSAPEVDEMGTTNLTGNLTIEQIPANVDTEYSLVVTVPDGYELLESNVGDDDFDNDFDSSTGQVNIAILECAGVYEFSVGFKKQ